MKLFIDTSNNKKIHLKLIKNDQIIDQMTKEVEFGSQMLLPEIENILKTNNSDYKSLTEIELNEGPGSFTGLRVGASVALALGFGLKIPVNGKHNLQVDLKYL